MTLNSVLGQFSLFITGYPGLIPIQGTKSWNRFTEWLHIWAAAEDPDIAYSGGEVRYLFWIWTSSLALKHPRDQIFQKAVVAWKQGSNCTQLLQKSWIMQIVWWQAVNMKALQLKDIQYILCAEQQ